jgi:molybdopterin-guanine dinucleotide biosynthesis protein A
MGRDKALLPFRGGTLAESVAAAVARAAGCATFVGHPDLYQSLGFPGIEDRYPGEGPLGGILTALGDTKVDWNLITACDMPAITSAFLIELLEAAESAEADSLVPVGPEGRLEPLCAVYHRRALKGLEARFAAGVRKISVALEAVRAVRFPVLEVSCFQNVNTPEEWAGL